MPIYEYRCKKCGYQFDVLQRVGADGRDLTCPECEEKNPEKMLSVFASSGVNQGGSSNSCSHGGGFT